MKRCTSAVFFLLRNSVSSQPAALRNRLIVPLPVPLLSILLSILLLAGTAQADSYFIWDNYGGTWSDADKTAANTDDDLMCWAAATSNILAYTGWGNISSQGLSNADNIFSYFQSHWTDEGGNVYYGVDWWFDGTNDTQGTSGWSQVDVAGGGFYPDLDVTDYYLFNSDDPWAMLNLQYLLINGYAATVSLTGPTGHAVTIWGFSWDADGYFDGLYLTDSDDYVNALRYYEVSFESDKWFLQDYSSAGQYYITEVYGLQIKIDEVPEPATVLLFGFGMTGLAALRRRKRSR